MNNDQYFAPGLKVVFCPNCNKRKIRFDKRFKLNDRANMFLDFYYCDCSHFYFCLSAFNIKPNVSAPQNNDIENCLVEIHQKFTKKIADKIYKPMRFSNTNIKDFSKSIKEHLKKEQMFTYGKEFFTLVVL